MYCHFLLLKLETQNNFSRPNGLGDLSSWPISISPVFFVEMDITTGDGYLSVQLVFDLQFAGHYSAYAEKNVLKSSLKGPGNQVHSKISHSSSEQHHH